MRIIFGRRANYIITNNVKDYRESVVEAITPEDYLKEIIGNTSV